MAEVLSTVPLIVSFRRALDVNKLTDWYNPRVAYINLNEGRNLVVWSPYKRNGTFIVNYVYRHLANNGIRVHTKSDI
jgi:hypothetical protein